MKYGLLLTIAACSEAPQPSGPGDTIPCEERSFDECEEDDRCYAVRATELDLRETLLCRLGTERLSCRTRGPNCGDDDAVTLSCDAGGRYWVTPQTCIPADNARCDAPDGFDASYPVCIECDQMSPPSVSLRAGQDTQDGVHGSYCIQYGNGQCSSCLERHVSVDSFVAVTQGTQLSFDSGDAQLIGGERCSPACPPTLHVQAVGDETSATETRLLNTDQTWTVDLAPGTYALWLDTHYESSASEGQIYVGFGLKVE